jgi:hypothetical protein
MAAWLTVCIPAVFAQEQHQAYFHALSDLRTARWLLDHVPGNWVREKDEINAVQKIDDAIGEIRRASIDDGRDINDHPVVEEKADRLGRLRDAAELLRRARADIDQETENGSIRGLHDRAAQHIEGAIQFTENAMRAGGVPPASVTIDRMQPGTVLNPGQSIFSTDRRFRLTYQADGNLVLYIDRDSTVLWASNTSGMGVGICTMQTDGNLVAYGPGRQPIWASNTWGSPGSYLIVQNDGNVVIYRPDGTAIWASNTGGR